MTQGFLAGFIVVLMYGQTWEKNPSAVMMPASLFKRKDINYLHPLTIPATSDTSVTTPWYIRGRRRVIHLSG